MNITAETTVKAYQSSTFVTDYLRELSNYASEDDSIAGQLLHKNVLSLIKQSADLENELKHLESILAP